MSASPDKPVFPASLQGTRIHLVGAKGTGVCALAELLVAGGSRVSGSDVAERFYTDEVLEALGVRVSAFSGSNVDRGVDLVIHSAAYSRESNPDLVQALSLGVPVMSYPEALGALSASRDSSAVCGVHGKTTTTALAGVVARAFGLPAAVLAGSAVGAFGGRSTLTLGSEMLIAETCEYRRHFLSFKPRRVALTSVEPDHQDYYPDYRSILSAFVEYLSTLPDGGMVVYCADDPGATEAWRVAKAARPDLRGLPYGFGAPGPFGLERYSVGNERAEFRLRGYDIGWKLRIPGRHIALDAAAALALCVSAASDIDRPADMAALRRAASELEAFGGSKRRSEFLGSALGVVFIDDYGHHPTAIKATLAGLKEFYPGRRLVVDFMSHTASRTKALLREFSEAFDDADLLVLHRIYPSAREAPDPSVSGRSIFELVKARGIRSKYFEEPLDALPYLSGELKAGDLFVTMGAGDNWRLGASLLEALKRDEPKETRP